MELKRKNITVDIKPSEVTCDKSIFEEAEKCVLSWENTSLDPSINRAMKWIRFLVEELWIDLESEDKLLKSIYKKAKKSDNFALIWLAKKVNKIMEFEERRKSISEEHYNTLIDFANKDGLTWVLNRREFDRLLERKIERGEKLSILFFDIDHFKQVNDIYWHLSWDLVLKKLANEIKTKIKWKDIFARYWWEEFIIILPGTNLKWWEVFSERIRKIIEDLEIIDDNWKKIKITISIWVVERKKKDDINSVLARADKALYEAKNSWRNIVISIRKLGKSILINDDISIKE